jgi:hypothetical protein
MLCNTMTASMATWVTPPRCREVRLRQRLEQCNGRPDRLCRDLLHPCGVLQMKKGASGSLFTFHLAHTHESVASAFPSSAIAVLPASDGPESLSCGDP